MSKEEIMKEAIIEALNLQSIGLQSNEIQKVMLQQHLFIKDSKLTVALIELGYTVSKMGEHGKYSIIKKSN